MKTRWFCQTIGMNVAALIADDSAQALFEYALVGAVMSMVAIGMMASVQGAAANTLAGAQTGLTTESLTP
jgi:hypothetical protein